MCIPTAAICHGETDHINAGERRTMWGAAIPEYETLFGDQICLVGNDASPAIENEYLFYRPDIERICGDRKIIIDLISVGRKNIWNIKYRCAVHPDGD